jgi:hypothetical protein
MGGSDWGLQLILANGPFDYLTVCHNPASDYEIGVIWQFSNLVWQSLPGNLIGKSKSSTISIEKEDQK